MSSEHTVLVLGAGASLSEAIQRRPRRSKEYPPLDATFFQNARKHKNTGLLDGVVEQAVKLGEHDLCGSEPPVSLEAHLGRLYFEMNHNPRKVSTRAYFDAVRLYAWEITETTNWMMDKPGLIKQVIQRELRAERKVSIVTFNVDLLAENALNRLVNARPGASWCLDTAYGFAEPKEALIYRRRGFEACFNMEPCDSEIPLFKMHGSVNWVFPHRDEHPPANLLSPGKGKSFYLLENQRLPQTSLKVKKGKASRPWYVSPLLVPPVYEKHGLIKQFLHDVWDGASAALEVATRVVFWGYSFPLADTHARHYFQGLSRENEALRNPLTINPDPNAESALWHVLRPASVRHYRSATDYLEDDF